MKGDILTYKISKLSLILLHFLATAADLFARAFIMLWFKLKFLVHKFFINFPSGRIVLLWFLIKVVGLLHEQKGTQDEEIEIREQELAKLEWNI